MLWRFFYVRDDDGLPIGHGLVPIVTLARTSAAAPRPSARAYAKARAKAQALADEHGVTVRIKLQRALEPFTLLDDVFVPAKH